MSRKIAIVTGCPKNNISTVEKAIKDAVLVEDSAVKSITFIHAAKLQQGNQPVEARNMLTRTKPAAVFFHESVQTSTKDTVIRLLKNDKKGKDLLIINGSVKTLKDEATYPTPMTEQEQEAA